jgi:hypothetical protein
VLSRGCGSGMGRVRSGGGGAGQRADRGDPRVPRHAGRQVIICRRGAPEAKGVVERANGYLETSFLPGRTFTGPGDFNSQLQGWLKLANSRPKRVLGCAPTQRVGADRAAMLTLPPVAPLTGWSSTLRLPRDYYVRLDANDYSVHPAAVGRRIQVSRRRLSPQRRVCCWSRSGTSVRSGRPRVGRTGSPLRVRTGCSDLVDHQQWVAAEADQLGL